MFPEPVAMAIRDPQSTDAQSVSPAAASPSHFQAALRIRAALRAAQEDAAEEWLPDGQWHEWTWTVKPFPRPPLVINSTEELNGEELLANDSPGG